MGNQNATAADKPGGTKQASAQLKDTVRPRRLSTQFVQNVILIWLDKNIDDNNADCRNTMEQLRYVINAINKFTDSNECIEFLKSMHDENACIIISGSLGELIVPRVHSMSQVDSIFIFCSNKERHEKWTKEWTKIKGVFTEIVPICEALKQAAQQCEQNAISISIMAANSDSSGKNLDQLDPSFMYTQILKEILLEIEFDEEHIEEFTDYCRRMFAQNPRKREIIRKLQTQYRSETPIWWYTYECFLYPMLNHALRLMDVNIIIKMGFLIADLHRQLDRLHKEQFGDRNSRESFTVYRGQGLFKDNFEQMRKTIGGLISFNNFLSTSKKPKVALNFTDRAVKNPDLVGILFVMIIDPAKSTTPFASIVHVSCQKDTEDEVLFSMNTAFRIGDIRSMGGNNRLFQVNLTLTNDSDKDLRQLTDSIREETFPNSRGWFRLGQLLLKIDQSDKAEEIYQTLLQQATNDNEKAPIYNQIGWVKDKQGEYKEALTFYEKSLQIYKKTLSSNDPDLAMFYNNIGLVYYNMGQFPKALSYYEKALEIDQKTLPSNHPDLAKSYNNIGEVYLRMREYPKALSLFEKTLRIQKETLPSYHSDLTYPYKNIGLVYENMGHYGKAHMYYERALDIGQHSLPSDHPDLEEYRQHLEKIKKKL